MRESVEVRSQMSLSNSQSRVAHKILMCCLYCIEFERRHYFRVDACVCLRAGRLGRELWGSLLEECQDPALQRAKPVQGSTTHRRKVRPFTLHHNAVVYFCCIGVLSRPVPELMTAQMNAMYWTAVLGSILLFVGPLRIYRLKGF